MDNAFIFSHVDHTLLAPTASLDGIALLCREAVEHGVASVCIPPSYVSRVRETYCEGLVVCTVIGFPLGYAITSVKEAEIRAALRDGADEFDAVVNLGDVKNHAFDKITGEIATLKQATEGRILKIIIENCYLTREEKISLCRAVTDGGADYIKTSTGFGSGGATMDDVLLMREHIGPGVKIKAAGGIRTREDMVSYIEAGCDRLGTSSAVKILCGGGSEGY